MVKRGFDIVASVFGLVVLSPVFVVIALVIKIRTPGPVMFRQVRTGRYGKPFVINKFRTMVPEDDGDSISIKGQSRITKPGAFLRKYKLDELPELWNVLKGDMSFVGPRPDLPEYTSRLNDEERLILNLRPGITGPATLKYSNEEELLAGVSDPVKYNETVIWPDKVRINVEYCKKRSFLGDIWIILRTVFGIR